MSDEKGMSSHDESVELVSRLAEILESGDLHEIDLTVRNERVGRVDVRLVKTGAVATVREAVQPYGVPVTAPGTPDSGTQSVSGGEGDDSAESSGLVTSEMIGIAYLKPAPDAPEPFVAVGAWVSEGDTLLIIEAMKTMNHIPAPHAGTVTKILVDDQDAVQYGTPLVVIEA